MSRARGLTIVLTACAFFAALTPALARDYPGKPLKSSTQAVLLSLAVPGAGQLYTKNYWKAAAFAVTQGSFLGAISWNNDRVKAAKKAHDSFIERSSRNQRNKMIWWLAGATLLSMGDAYVDAHLYGLDWSPEISMNDRGVSGGLSLAVRF